MSISRFLKLSPDPEPAGGATPQQPQPNIATPNADDIATALVAALDARQQRAENSVIRSFAEQNHMSVEEITQLLETHKAQQKNVIPEDIQAQINQRMQTADNRLIAAEVKAIGTQLNLVDIDAAFALMDKSEVKVDETGTVTGVQEALNALIEAKPYLVKSPTPSGTGSAGNFPRNSNTDSADYATRLADARKSGNNTLATAIISEAASKGIILR